MFLVHYVSETVYSVPWVGNGKNFLKGVIFKKKTLKETKQRILNGVKAISNWNQWFVLGVFGGILLLMDVLEGISQRLHTYNWVDLINWLISEARW